ncbi:MAG: hypothetical protein KJ025_07750 [Burkholderiales bacterium]|nr:hypothetical protein [Burkholderiales bacterium]
MGAAPRIYCPKCEYRPVAEDRWECIPSCGTAWHTFWTGGVCPGCGYAWLVTQCPACGGLSPHKQWYHSPEGTPGSEREHEFERSGA